MLLWMLWILKNGALYKTGIDVARTILPIRRSWVIISVNDDEDLHFRKAEAPSYVRSEMLMQHLKFLREMMPMLLRYIPMEDNQMTNKSQFIVSRDDLEIDDDEEAEALFKTVYAFCDKGVVSSS